MSYSDEQLRKEAYKIQLLMEEHNTLMKESNALRKRGTKENFIAGGLFLLGGCMFAFGVYMSLRDNKIQSE